MNPALRVAVLNAMPLRPVRWSRGDIHPAAATCLVALANTPWFFSKAIAKLQGNLLLGPVHNCGVPVTRYSPVKAELLRPDQIQAGKLRLRKNPTDREGFDVLVVPGGSCNTDAKMLGLTGIEAIRSFVLEGGGYCGVCAGAFLGLGGTVSTTTADGVKESMPRLGLASDVATEDDHSPTSDYEGELAESESDVEEDSSVELSKSCKRCRLPRLVKVRFSHAGRRWLWDEDGLGSFCSSVAAEVEIRYHNGPLLRNPPTGSKTVCLARMWTLPQEEAKVLAARSPEELKQATAASAALSSALFGAAAAVAQDFGDGRAVLISPHPESTHEGGELGPGPGKPRLRRVFQRAVLMAAAGHPSRRWIEDLCYQPWTG